MARVGIIGAGAAGLVAARYFRDSGFVVEVWEMADDVGGTWLYSEAVVEGRGNLYRSLSTNLPKEIMQYSDLPFEGDLPSFVRHTDVEQYLRQYADTFELRPLIRFNTEVTLVERLPQTKGSAGGLWKVTHRSRSSTAVGDEGNDHGNTTTDRYDIVLVCNGHFSKIFAPPILGLDSFPGTVLHSQQYREPTPFIGKTVVVIGSGASGVDITREVATKASTVYAVVRSKLQPPPSPAIGGPATTTKTAVADVFGHSPALVMKSGCEVRRVRPDGVVEFSDDSATEEPVDAIIFCTGYRYHFPFLSPSCRVFLHPEHAAHALLREDGRIRGDIDPEEYGMSVWPLFEHVLHIEHPSLAFIGLNWKVLPFACFETQVRFALAIMRHPHFLTWDADANVDLCINHIDDDDGAITHSECASMDLPTTKRAMMKRMWQAWLVDSSTSIAAEMQRRRLREYHMLGSQQWSYYAQLQKLARQADSCAQACAAHNLRKDDCSGQTQATTEDSAQKRDWTRIRAIYEDVGQARLHSPDTYRSRQYELSPSDPNEWTVH